MQKSKDASSLKLKPGQRLSENSLAKEIGVSRTPVREALRRLAGEGWLTLVADTGVWVSSPTRREILNAYEFRAKLETWGVEMAMPNDCLTLFDNKA